MAFRRVETNLLFIVPSLIAMIYGIVTFRDSQRVSWLVDSLLIAVPLVLAWRGIRLSFIVGDDSIVVHNICRTWTVPLGEVDHLEIVSMPWLATVLVRSNGKRLRVSALAPPNQLVRSTMSEIEDLVARANSAIARQKTKRGT